ncbi:MAG: ribosome maturation factor RimM [Casimicrobiaceae bacterium]
MGRLLAPFGIKGWCRLRPFSAVPDALLGHKAWWLAPADGNGAWSQYRVVEAHTHGASIIAALAGVATREAAQALRGFLAGVPRATLPKVASGEHYWSDLVGLAVVNRSGQTLGRVAGLLDTGAHPVLQVAGGEAERLIPLVAAYVDAIEPAARRIVVDWPEDY